MESPRPHNPLGEIPSRLESGYPHKEKEMTIYIVIAAILVLPMYFIWSVIHEFSHLIAAKATVGVSEWEIKPYPHIYNGKLRWSGYYASLKKSPTKKQTAAIYLAPRVPDLAAASLLPWTVLLPAPVAFLAAAFCMAGLVDLFVGSLGISDLSDLKRAAKASGYSPWYLRMAGFGNIFLSLILLALVLVLL